MATSGFLTKDNLPYFAVDHDDDGGFTLSQIATSGDVLSLLPTFGQLGYFKTVDGFRPGSTTGLAFSWVNAIIAGGHAQFVHAVLSLAAPASSAVSFDFKVSGTVVASATIPASEQVVFAEIGAPIAGTQRLDVVVTSGTATDLAVSLAVNPFAEGFA